MGHWTLDDIPWDSFDRSRLDPETVKIAKAACMVEHHSGDYGVYLRSVFFGDPEFAAAATAWAEEEIQHGKALRRYAELADPSFDFDEAFTRFAAGHRIETSAHESIRGSRCGELVARCVVEVGTSAYYSALRDSVEEPVFREICRRIAADEFRHYKLFYNNMKRYQALEGLSIFTRVKVAAMRMIESTDDELAYAYHCGSGEARPYDRRRCVEAYAASTFPRYRYEHVERGLGMTLKAVGIKPQGALGRLLTRLAWAVFQRYAESLQRKLAHA
ncbi:MAG: ferritin-like domain-containing protein [Alphaproteobacteria bacterium]|nr:ferritin-like domain-containing protein [Alphaproteobacteria bacterium]